MNTDQPRLMSSGNAAARVNGGLDDLLTAQEVARILRVRKGWVYDHADGRRQPKLPCYEISDGGRKLRRFSRKHIEDFLKECEKWANG